MAWTTPPVTCPLAVVGLIALPTSKADAKWRILTSPVCLSTLRVHPCTPNVQLPAAFPMPVSGSGSTRPGTLYDPTD
ncbi:MAG: hypothetical protein BWY99_02547 [Synergistetes bacterium ADurb.BinA166]|nr:MAG: hypothetical protein BWY99_02547 [Synergistetes bacterium ADurb.BinA166]